MLGPLVIAHAEKYSCTEPMRTETLSINTSRVLPCYLKEGRSSIGIRQKMSGKPYSPDIVFCGVSDHERQIVPRFRQFPKNLGGFLKSLAVLSCVAGNYEPGKGSVARLFVIQ